MNTLLQDESLLIGSHEEIQKLAAKDSARILVVSDSHGAYSSLLLIMRQFGAACDALVFCGDGICDISKLISNSVDDDELKSIIPPVIGIVEGNNDADLYPVRNILSCEPYYVQLKVPLFNVLEACGQKIFFTHGHRNSLYNGTSEIVCAAKKNSCKIALYGHTHIATEKLGEIFTVNPGSCSRPRGGQRPSFAVLNLTNSGGFECIFYELSLSGSKPFFPARTV